VPKRRGNAHARADTPPSIAHASLNQSDIDACGWVQIPNGCGSFLGAVQLVLYAIYRDSNSGGKQQAGDDVEMASDAKSSKKVADDVGGKEDRLV
jgi:hypothetical protein